jgi:excinuclease UvrABC ATPase subunit
MGPEAGKNGGQDVFAGPPEQLVKYATNISYAQPSVAKTKVKSVRKKKEPEPTEGIVRESLSSSARLRSYTGEALATILNP